jgi:hypothetical protein
LRIIAKGDRVKKARKLHESPPGDRWYLIQDPSGVFVRHESSGGDIEHVEIGTFLSGDGPEQQALLGLIGTLVEEHHVGS